MATRKDKGEPSRTGRPSSLKPEMVEQARKLCEKGFTDQELADFFEVNIRTIYRWKHESEAFCHALKLGKEAPDDRVERSLYAAAVGYEGDDIDIRVVQNRVVQTRIRRWFPPSVVAAIFYLKNRRPEKWRDKLDAAVSVTPAELAAAVREEMAKADG